MEETLDLSLSHSGHNSEKELNLSSNSNSLFLKDLNEPFLMNGLENENQVYHQDEKTFVNTNFRDVEDDAGDGEEIDGEDNLSDSSKLKELSMEELKLKEKKIRKLKAALRNEENKLIILKKIKQSQLMKENISSIASHSSPSSLLSSSFSSHSHLLNTSIKSQINPNRLHRPLPSSTISSPANTAHHSSHRHIKAAHLGSRPHSVLNPPLSNRHISNYGPPPPPIGMTSHRSNHVSNHPLSHGSHHHQSFLRSNYNSLNRTPVTTPPNVVLGYPVQDLRASHSSTQLSGSTTNGNSPLPSEATQTSAQRQAAAKLALRKQLEKTLLQIPPPKPPPPEIHFIPNANNSEFIYYYGLETIVDFLIDNPNQNKLPPEPFECVQCGIDFTPVWKWQDKIDVKRDRPTVICETCVTSNIKKALKAEHTNRLKTAFVKALQQEQEIEQRIASGASSPPLTPSITPPNPPSSFSNQIQTNPNNHLGSIPVMPQAPPAHSSFPRLSGSSANAAAAAAQLANSAALLQKLPNFSAAHQSLIQAQLQQLAQSLPQPQPAHLLSFAPLLYQYGAMLGKPGAVSSDIHRQYLLDMIPPRSMTQNSGLNWKT